MHRFIAIFLFAISTCLSLRASGTDDRVKLPDFAYPQDVIKTATELIKSRSADERVLGALELWNAKKLIDNNSAPESMKFIISLSDKEKDPAVKALLKLMAAQIANNFRYNRTKLNLYFDNIGTYDEQETNMDSIIGSILKTALDVAPPTTLTQFRNVLDWNEIGLTVLPTVRDFVAWYCAYLDSSLIPFVQHNIDTDSPVYFAISEDISRYNKRRSYADMLSFLNNRNAAYALYLYINHFKSLESMTLTEKQEQIKFLEKAKEMMSGEWVEETIDNRLKLLYAPYYNIEYCNEIKYPEDLTLKLTTYKLDSLTLNIYKFKSKPEAEEYSRYKDPIHLEPFLTKKYKCDADADNYVSTDTIHLEPGAYLLSVPADTARLISASKGIVCIYPYQIFYFESMSKKGRDVLQAIDVNSGAPVPGLEGVYCRVNENKIESFGTYTDDKGCIFLPDNVSRSYVGFLNKKTGEVFYYYERISSSNRSIPENDDNSKIDIQVCTDLSVYRPGQKVKFILTAIDNEKTIEGLTSKIYIKLPNNPETLNSFDETDSDTLQVIFAPTDKFGRSVAEITLPESSPLGYATIRSQEQENEIGYFKIADFKLNDLQFSKFDTSLTTDSVIVTGYTTNTAGIGVGNTKIMVHYSYSINSCYKNDIPWQPDEITTESNNQGEFRIAVPRYYSKNLKKWCTNYDPEDLDEDDDDYFDNDDFMAHFHFAGFSQNGRNAAANLTVEMQYPLGITLHTKYLFDKKDNLKFTVYVSGKETAEYVNWILENRSDRKCTISGQAKPGEVVIPPSLLKKIKCGEYTLRVEMPKSGLAQPQEEYIYLYDLSWNEVPSTSPFILVDEEKVGNEGEITVGISNDDTYLWMEYVVKGKEDDVNNIIINKYHLNHGWHHLPYKISGLPEGYSNVQINLYTVNKSGNLLSRKVQVTPTSKDVLSLSCESFRDNLTPNSQESWTFITMKDKCPVKAAVFLNMINSKMLQFGTPPRPTIKPYVNKITWYRNLFTLLHFNNWYNKTLKPQINWYHVIPSVELPDWREINFPITFPEDGVVVTAYGISSNMPSYRSSSGEITNLKYSADDFEEESSYDDKLVKAAERKTIQDAINSVIIREPKVYTALWEPMLTTGNDGRVDVSFTVPGETTGWELFAEAWTTDLLSARLTHSFTAVKPLVVAPNPPRFVRVGDSVNLVSAITNATDSVMDVSVWVTVEGDSISLADAQSDFTLAAGETRFVNTPVSVDVTGGQLVYTVRASNGITGDGERNAIPVLTSTALVTESRNFYLNPGQAEFSISLPSPEGTDFSSELHFTANPMWSVVEALPKAIEPWCKAASALAMSIYTSNTALDLNRRFPQAKDVIDIANARKVADQSLAGLRELQTNDGGFKWGVWADGPDRHSTLAVLDWLASEKERPEIAALINPALEYVDKTAVGKDGKVDTDFLYTVVRSFYGMPADQNGSRVVNATVTDMLRNWKKYSIDQKALTVIALKNYGYDKVAKTILGSLSQFGRMTDDRGFEFPNIPTILAYTHTLEAFASADPNSDIARRIVQHLLYIRQGMDWGSSAFTSYAVRSIMTAASSWVTKASPVAVSVDGVTLPTDADGLSGVVNTPVSGRRVTVSRTEPSTPAYGAVVSRFVAPLSDIAPFSDGEVTVTKTIVRVSPDGSQEVLGQNVAVTPGERLTVILKVTAKRPLSNLVVTDNRPAAFEPVVQVPRMVWNRTGSPFYLENRDAMTNIYISYMPAGAAEYSYEVTVNNTGAFTTGLATVTSAIAPEITAHSGSTPFSLSNAK